MKSLKNRLAAGALALGIGATAALGTSTVTAGEASAQVANGKYTWYATAGVPSAPSQVTIRGNWLTVHTPFRQGPLRIHPTRHGGYIDIGVVRYVLTKHGRSYSGPTKVGPVVIGDNKLVPRR